MQPDSVLEWFFLYSASELGLRGQWVSEAPVEGNSQRWPTALQVRAAAKQRRVRQALEQLSPRLQSILECVYESRFIPLDERHRHDLAAPLVARAMTALKAAKGKEERKVLAHVVDAAPVLVDAAHRAFRLAYDDEPVSRPERRRRRVGRFLREVGLGEALSAA